MNLYIPGPPAITSTLFCFLPLWHCLPLITTVQPFWDISRQPWPFFKILSHCHFPFYPHSISPPSWSLYHCHSHTNLPATAASSHTTFLTANLCSGRTHPSSGSLRCAAPSPAALRCTPSGTEPQLRTACNFLRTLLTKYSQAEDGQGQRIALFLCVVDSCKDMIYEKDALFYVLQKWQAEYHFHSPLKKKEERRNWEPRPIFFYAIK